jgi:hypothetical protein
MRAARFVVTGQLGRSLDVDEEHGDLLALAPERAALGQDALGEMAGRVGGGGAR